MRSRTYRRSSAVTSHEWVAAAWRRAATSRPAGRAGVLAALIAISGVITPAWAQEGDLDPDSESSNPNQALVDNPWSVMFYRASSSTRTFGETIKFGYESANEVLYVFDLAYTLPLHTGISEFFQHVGAVFGVAGNLTLRDEKNHDNRIPEVNAYATWRWLDLPWNRAVATSFAIGYGLSYASEVPELEYLTARRGEPQKLMNFLMIEASLALPSLPTAQFVTRVHHRSGTYGLMGPERVGSNAIAFGLRMHF